MAVRSEHAGRDALLHELLPLLARHGIARRWAQSTRPQSDLELECLAVGTDDEKLGQFARYLRDNPAIQRSVESLLAHLAVAANARVEHLPPPQDVLFASGSRIARWLPTFLIVDGPLGRFLRSSESPLNVLLRSDYAQYPILAEARDAFNHDLFRRVRNGVGHWSFAFEHRDGEARLVCFHWETGARTADISLLEAEALHLVSFAVIECLDKNVFRIANP